MRVHDIAPAWPTRQRIVVSDSARCTGPRCHHTRAAHEGTPDRREAEPTGCSVMICNCEAFRAEGDR